MKLKRILPLCSLLVTGVALSSFEGLTKEEPAKDIRSVAILGDSYSTFENCVTPDTNAVWYYSYKQDCTDVDSVSQTWWGRFLDDTGLRLTVNNSFSGSTICHTGYNGEDYTNRSFVNRMPTLGNPDLILVFGATNDYWAKVPFGNKDGETEMGLQAFLPAMHRLTAEMPRLYPDSRLCFMLNDEIQGEMRDSIISICSSGNIPVLQLENIDKQCGHPTAKGMAQINTQLKQLLGY